MNIYTGKKGEVLPLLVAEELDCTRGEISTDDVIRASGGLLIRGEYLAARSFRLSQRTSSGARRYESGPYDRIWQVTATLGDRRAAQLASTAEMIGMVIVYGSLQDAMDVSNCWIEQSLAPNEVNGDILMCNDAGFLRHYVALDSLACTDGPTLVIS